MRFFRILGKTGQTSPKYIFIGALFLAIVIGILLLYNMQAPSGKALSPVRAPVRAQPLYELEVTISTLEDEYLAGEDVDLTDPPAEGTGQNTCRHLPKTLWLPGQQRAWLFPEL